MTAFFIDASRGTNLELEVTCEKDETVFLALVFDKADATGTSVLEAQSVDTGDIEEFFFQVGKAKADYERLTGKKLP